MRVSKLCFVLMSVAIPIISVAGEAASQNNPSSAKATENEENAAGQSLEAPYLVRFHEVGTWQAGAVRGKPVFGIDGEKIGTADDVLIGKDGRVAAVVIDVGGYLGIAAKSVAVKIDAFEIAPGATQGTADAASARNPSAAPDAKAAAEDGKGAPGGTGGNPLTDGNDGAVKLGPDGLPERLVARVSRQQLEDAPALE